MKKSLIALATLAVVSAASAQSTVTISGGMLLGLGTTKTGAASSGTQMSRQTGNIAFKGTEDLGGGLKASFDVLMETGNFRGAPVTRADSGMGVSTSRKLCSTMKLRMELTVLLRATKRARACSSVIRST